MSFKLNFLYSIHHNISIINVIHFRQPSDIENISKEAIVNSESKENEGGGWWDSLYSAAKSKVFLFLFLSYYSMTIFEQAQLYTVLTHNCLF